MADQTIRIPNLKDLDPGSLICSRCQVPAQFIEPDANLDTRRLTCPQCLRSEKFDVAVARATEYIEKSVTDQMQASLTRAFAGSKSVDFIPDKPTQPPAFIFPLKMRE